MEKTHKCFLTPTLHLFFSPFSRKTYTTYNYHAKLKQASDLRVRRIGLQTTHSTQLMWDFAQFFISKVETQAHNL